MKKFTIGLILMSNIFFNSCNSDLKSDIEYFKSEGWSVDEKFNIDTKGTFKMGDYSNFLLKYSQKDTILYFEYLKREESLKALRYEKIFYSKKNNSTQELYHRLGFSKRDTLFYYTSTIPENTTNIDSMFFIKGKEYYLKEDKGL